MNPLDALKSLLGGRASAPSAPSSESIAAFWRWFEANAHALADRGPCLESATAIHQQLQRVGGELVPELGSPDADRRLMLAISPDGIPEALPWADEVVAAAPQLPAWEIRACRPRKPLERGQVCAPNPITPDAASFLLTPSEEDAGKQDLVLRLPDELPPPLLSQFGFQLLDAALGERAVITSIGTIDFAQGADLAEWGLDPAAFRSLLELPDAMVEAGVPLEPPRG